jgi:hypothetical protein
MDCRGLVVCTLGIVCPNSQKFNKSSNIWCLPFGIIICLGCGQCAEQQNSIFHVLNCKLVLTEII